MKQEAAKRLMANYTGKRSIDQIIKSAVDYAGQADLWNTAKDGFFHMTERLDGFRNEDFFKVFPELLPLTETYR
jgi:iron uptake system EfeUOB component EfeO/EfeM